MKAYLRLQFIIEAFQLPLGKQSKVSSLPANTKPALQLNLHKSPTTLAWSWRHEEGETLVPVDSTSAAQVLAETQK